jgi:hypothetical protein
MGVLRLKIRAIFPISETLHRLLKEIMAPPPKKQPVETAKKPETILVESRKIPECLVLTNGSPCRSKKNVDRKNLLGTYLLPECTTWLVTWNNIDFSVATLQLAGRYFTFDTRLIESGDFGLFFGEKRVEFNKVVKVYDETWKTYEDAGVVFLDANECRKDAENRVLIFLPLARSQKLLPYLLRMLLQKIYT